MKSIKTRIYNTCIANGATELVARSLSDSADALYREFADKLDKKFAKEFDTDNMDTQFNLLTELAYTTVLSRANLNLIHKGDNGLDVWIDNWNAWGEYRNICAGTDMPPDKSGFLSRLTNAIEAKILKVNHDLHKPNSRVNKAHPVILFFNYSLLTPTVDNVLYQNRMANEPPIELKALCGNAFIMSKQNKDVTIKPRYFLDKTVDIWDKNLHQKVHCDTTYISAAVFSETITNAVFDPNWSNDLIVIHNPNARNPIKKNLIPSCFEYKLSKSRIQNGHYIKCKETHDPVA